MKSFDTDMKKYAEKIRLTAAERRDLRERISSYMEYHPLPKRKEMREGSIESQPFFIFSFNTPVFKMLTGSFAVLLLIFIPIFAERSVPGDVLYLVKTEINEGIRAQFANSPYEKVAFETRLIERRIAEARLLAEEGKLTEEVEAEIAETVKSHAEAAQLGLEELRASSVEDAAVAEIAFDSALDVQAAVLDTDISEASTSSTEAIMSAVKNAREEAVAKRGNATPSFVPFMARIEEETTRAYELFSTIKDSATAEERRDIERRLSDIDRKIKGAKNAENDPESVRELASTLGLIQRLIVYMTDIDVRRNVPLERLVPVEPTIEERTELVNAGIASATIRIAGIEEKIAYIEDEGVREKVALGIDDLTHQLKVATTSLKAQDIATAEQALIHIEALVADLESLTEDVTIPEEASENTEEGEHDPETVAGTSTEPTQNIDAEVPTNTESEI